MQSKFTFFVDSIVYTEFFLGLSTCSKTFAYYWKNPAKTGEEKQGDFCNTLFFVRYFLETFDKVLFIHEHYLSDDFDDRDFLTLMIK